MLKVWKYPLNIKTYNKIELPIRSEILEVNSQSYSIYLWALVDPDKTITEVRTILVVGTGSPIEDRNIDFINSFQMTRGQLVFHAFEIK